MKEFPRFTDSTIQYTITQPQMKLLTAILADYIEHLELDHSTQKINALIATGKQYACGELPRAYLTIPEKLLTDCQELIETLMGTYLDKKTQYVDRLLGDLNDRFTEHFDREVFDLAEGETLKIAESHSV